MKYVLGIDTGGTFTDGVIIDAESRKILKKAKSPTTREDLTGCIEKCIEALNFSDYSEVEMVVLSTTLATNSVVEGRESEIGLIIIGEEIEDDLPCNNYVYIDGGHDSTGRAVMALDEETIRRAVHSFVGKVKAIAISGYFSIRNPEHEQRARDIVAELCDLPVVCAHELTTSLGFQQRTITAALNAKLIPIITDLYQSLVDTIQKKDMHCPIMVVKSDGSINRIDMLKERPIETILSGPAASIMGAFNLTQAKDAIVMDIGGTTTDIAMIENSEVNINPEGALVGGWRTRVMAAEVYTFGLGGDSYLKIDSAGKYMSVGPQRVFPLCYMADRFPHLLSELEAASKDQKAIAINQKTDAFIFLKQAEPEMKLTHQEQLILNSLQEKPHTLLYLARKLGIDPDFFPYGNLTKYGLLGHVSYTPTDVLHALGESSIWSREAAVLGAGVMARQLGMDQDAFLARAEREIVDCMAVALLQSLVYMEGNSFDIRNNDKSILVRKMLKNDKDKYFDLTAKVRRPVIAIGAPVEAWLPKLKKVLDYELIIPEHAEVANAFGAATGNIVEKADILIKPNVSVGGYGVHLPWGLTMFVELDDAVEYAEKEVRKWIHDKAVQAGSEEPVITIKREELAADADGVRILIEVHIKATAVGRPMKWNG